jgi:hypothetical protein
MIRTIRMRLSVIGILLSLAWAATGQASLLQTRVSLRYQQEKLGTILHHISDHYDVRFTYSSHFIPVHQSVSIQVENVLLSTALDRLFAETGVVYANIGGQIVLKMSTAPPKSEPQQLSQINTLPKSVKQTSPIHPPNERELALIEQMQRERALVEQMQRERNQSLSVIEKRDMMSAGLSTAPQEFDLDKDALLLPPQRRDMIDETRMAQISILPFVGTNALRSASMTNKFSVNVLWGMNGGVDGLEIGGMLNHLRYDMTGVQVAGFGNAVAGDVIGTQIGGLFNISEGRTKGVQVAGIFNVSGNTEALQVAGMFNHSQDFAGVQTAGLFNISKGKADGVQVGTLFNVAHGKTKNQLALLFNVAQDVEVGQLSMLFNSARHLKGFQIALINASDTVSGLPLSLLTFVRKGYNRIEFSAGEALYANLGFKMGARSFYNIFHFGARRDEVTIMPTTPPSNGEPADEQTELLLTWGLGYGLGTTIGLGKRALINLEAVAIHINEQENWTRELNLLNQFRLLFDVRTGRHTSIFAGPVANMMISRLNRPQYDAPGSMIVPYTLAERTIEDATLKLWIGFQAGIRF